jgi:hypothetical protein
MALTLSMYRKIFHFGQVLEKTRRLEAPAEQTHGIHNRTVE